MTPELIRRYQYGGDISTRLANDYGDAAAQMIARAASTGDRYAVGDALNRVRHGSPLPQSTTAILVEQLVTDPLGAPLDAANKAVTTLAGNTFLAFFRNPAVVIVLLIIGGILYLHFLGVPKWARR